MNLVEKLIPPQISPSAGREVGRKEVSESEMRKYLLDEEKCCALRDDVNLLEERKMLMALTFFVLKVISVQLVNIYSEPRPCSNRKQTFFGYAYVRHTLDSLDSGINYASGQKQSIHRSRAHDDSLNSHENGFLQRKYWRRDDTTFAFFSSVESHPVFMSRRKNPFFSDLRAV
jgi:hypothetical protein